MNREIVIGLLVGLPLVVAVVFPVKAAEFGADATLAPAAGPACGLAGPGCADSDGAQGLDLVRKCPRALGDAFPQRN